MYQKIANVIMLMGFNSKTLSAYTKLKVLRAAAIRYRRAVMKQ
jgi:hypothetical protein